MWVDGEEVGRRQGDIPSYYVSLLSSLSIPTCLSTFNLFARGLAHAETQLDDDDSQSPCPLGLVPHQVRLLLQHM